MLAAHRMMHRPFLDWVGTQRNSAGTTYAFSSVTVAAHVAGSWTTQSATAQTLVELGLADAYYVETVVSAVGPTGEHQTWLAGFGARYGIDGGDLGRESGVVVDTDGASWTLYLFHNNSIVSSVVGASNITVGCTFKLLVDFTARTATAYINGVAQASVDFTSQFWYWADNRERPLDYSSIVLADSPVGYWPCDSTADGLGGSNTLALQGTGAALGATGIRPRGGGSLHTTGPSSTGWAQSATALTALSGASAFTFEAWIKFNSFVGSPQYTSDILGWYDGTTYYEMLRLGHGVNGDDAKPDVALSTSTVQQTNTATNALGSGTVYHIVCTWTSGTAPKVYVNGSLVTMPSSTIGGTLRAQSTPFGIGSSTSGVVTGRIPDGYIQDVAIYATALSAARVAVHYACG